MLDIRRSLTLRIAVPVAVLALVLGASLYFLVLTTITGFVMDEIERDLKSLSHRVYNICNLNFDDMLHAGMADDQDTLIIKQALTLGQFEDFFRQENLEGLVYRQKSGELLLETILPMSPEKIMAEGKQQGKIISLGTEAEGYFAYHFDFSPWEWQIIIIKSKREYFDLIAQVQRVHFITLGLLILAVFLLVFFLYQSIKRPIDAIIKPIKRGKRPKYIGIDVFEFLSDTIVTMMDSLQESEEKYRSLVETTSDFVWEVDQNGVYTYASPAIKDILGYTPEELLGKTLFDLVAFDEEERIKTIFFDIVTSKMPIKRLENVYRQKNGRQVVLETSGVPIFDIDGHLLGYRGIDRDITERKQVEEEKLVLERRIQRAEKAESLSTMAGAVAHHFNNMLAATIGNLELVMEGLPLGSKLSENLAAAQKAAWRAADMSSLMLTFLGQSQGKLKSHDFSENCRQHLMQLRKNMPEGFCVETDLPVSGPIIKADLAQIRQVLSAMFINAEEAIEGSSGKVHVSVRTLKATEIPEGYRVPAGWVPSASVVYACMAITDTGRGMDTETIGRIFDPFYTDKFTGRGIGLAVALGIVKAHGGGITVESDPGHGSTFQVFLPLSDEDIPLAKEIAVQTPPTIESGSAVLLVEDQDVVRSMAKEMLERIGFEVLIAKDGVEAVEIFRENQKNIGLVISDLSMPRMNGWETLTALRAIRPDIPVILSSGYDEARVMADDHAEQPQAFLHKPYQMKTLKEILGLVLGGKGAI